MDAACREHETYFMLSTQQPERLILSNQGVAGISNFATLSMM